MERDEALEILTRSPSTTGIFSDFDGTLSEITDHPEDALPVPGALETLDALAGAFRVVGVISGRPLEDLRSRLGRSEIVVAGSHGRERSDRWGFRRATEGWETVAVAAVSAIEHLPGIVLERTGTGVALHFRTAPEREEEARQLAEDLAREFELDLRPGRLVVELVAPGPGKDDALETLVHEGELSTFLFAGDDADDLEAFERARGLQMPCVLVAVVSEETPEGLREAADIVVSGPTEYLEFLVGLRDAMRPPD